MKKIFRFLFKILLWLLVLPIFGVVVFKWVPVPVTPLMVIRYFEQKEAKKETVWKHNWVSIDEISENLQLAVICSEDQNFLKHNGFDLKAIEKAFESNQKSGKVRGGSTISQQTAKNVFLWPQRSWLRKGMETYVTFWIELIWSKKRIMEVYLNSIEMGNGIYGAEAASQFWFQKSASKLSKSEASAIAAILPRPLMYRANPPTNYIAGRKLWIMKQMRFYGALNYEKKDEK
ncbi:monofunctional biosynthetic peptidoglycan transglycosylase [Gelidibacter maritimus]|uniref:Biosynthetic peptidoglycan transglycosylase n=1 Tax=Gelidibacter maritimus TaxID=2761487 RepID=A0A7W2R4P8_9FLAO|nr:monofunctional biosynthetic peptidoglycan transglycosylase [Gelidibacter maritimus]MBA6153913.1 monofunctional biosynthetic peptidoglycan transglycosylase [Gelidibacter maritimus]